MILKNKIFFILPFIIACFVNCSVSAITRCNGYSQQQCGTHTGCEWSGDFDTGSCIQSEPSESSESNICNILSRDECKNNNCCTWFSLSTATDDDDENGKCLLKPNSGSDCTGGNCSPNEYYNVSGCVACPSEYPESLGGIQNPKKTCYNSCNGTTYHFDDGQTVPCSCLTTPGACDLSRCAKDEFGCSSCTAYEYLDTTTHTCKSCPDNFPYSDDGAIGINACYQSCDACNNALADPLSHIGPMCKSINGPKVYNNTGECQYEYNCAAGYYINMSATNYSTSISCQQCDNLPTDATYTDYGATRSDECPWILTCAPGYVYDKDEKKCNPCPDAAPVSWYKNTTPLSITYRFNGSYISATDDDNPSHNGTEQDDNLPYCDGNVFTVTLNNTPNNEIIANSDDLETTIFFKYNDKWYQDAYLKQSITYTNKLKTPISWGDFDGYYYYIQGTDTKVFDADGTPVVENSQNITANVTLNAHYKTPELTYYAKIVAGEGDSNANRCTYTGNDSQCELPRRDNYDGYDITFDTNNRYEALDKDNKSLGYIQREDNNILKFVPTTVDALITMRSPEPYIYIDPKLCPVGYYCQNFTKTKCPAEITTDAGAKSQTDCKTFTNKTKFKDNNLSQNTFFRLPIAVKMAKKLQNKLNGEQSQNP